MKRAALILLSCVLSACATTNTPEVTITAANTGRAVEAVKQAPFDVDKALETAKAAYGAENYSAALKAYQSVLIRHPNDMAARLGAADTVLALGRGETALTFFKALDSEETLTDTQRDKVNIGLSLSKVLTEQTDNPEGVLNAALEIDDTDPRIWNALGLYRDSYGDWMKAQDSFVMALSTGAASSAIINNMGLSLMKQGRYQEAVDKFGQAMTLNPHKAIYDNNRRMTLIMMERYGDAFANVSDKRAASLYNDAGFMAMQKGKKKRAKFFFEKAIEISPSYHKKAAANLEALKAG